MSEYGVIERVNLPDGRIIDVTPLTYGRARVHIGPDDSQWYTDEW